MQYKVVIDTGNDLHTHKYVVMDLVFLRRKIAIFLFNFFYLFEDVFLKIKITLTAKKCSNLTCSAYFLMI